MLGTGDGLKWLQNFLKLLNHYPSRWPQKGITDPHLFQEWPEHVESTSEKATWPYVSWAVATAGRIRSSHVIFAIVEGYGQRCKVE